ncbi:response regulator transcription factor [Flavobacterium sp. UBA7682]|uniref:response regulator transcription factor n=1 Tax=Flavobacterium sp. UBA7682 TaxID=1946560 RepID=UPI0025BE05D1|nr:response regulator transcription factor [Flavobacterium sp. UBA7682]
MVTVALVDDHQLFRKSLSLLLNSFDGISTVFDTDDGKSLFVFLEDASLDVALLDLQMPLMDGYELCKLLRSSHPQVKIIIVSQLTTKEAVHKVMELGANGFFTKNSPPEQLEIAIRSVMEKDYYFDLELSAVIREAILWEKKFPGNSNGINGSNFSRREIEIILLSCRECSSKEIASKLFISVRTVEKHRNHIMEKANSKNFIGAILYALKNNYISLDDV